ncbi:MAG: thioredoxin domain-containing protein [Aquificaceae bacterium]|nr:thioredoxin domain-containing protein [Aquificaceae bacterium]MDW8237329.1 thioredoxin domain-containing protein [Aquificaceae bacterium]
MNRLSRERSPYLRASSHQKIDWYPWSEEAFLKAKELDRPILLSIGGIWCHWCHVMAHESFENEEIANIINENFVAIKVDRDERPDIDRRYQEVVFALTGSGGWPLTAFLTPDGEAFFGGTYFPPEDRYGRIGFKNLLLRISELWKGDRHRVLSSAKSISESLRSHSLQNYKDNVGYELLSAGISATLTSIDYNFGGLGSAPKFHHAKAFELLIYHYYFSPSEPLKRAIELSLDAMALGGIYDQLLGGFFRYSTDERWLVPHFEKMLYDNAELLKLYSIAYTVFKKDLYLKVAEGIVRYYKEKSSDPLGGFYASQDADIGNLDEGGYYTFSLEEIESILTSEESRVASLYFGIGPKGHMHHNPKKCVLSIAESEERVANLLGLDTFKLKSLIESSKRKLLSYREQNRQEPVIDKSIYSGWNGLMIEALCEYYKLSKDAWSLEFAKLTLDRIQKELIVDSSLMRVIGVDGACEDYIFLARGALSLYELTQTQSYLDLSLWLIKRARELFWDESGWGFFDAKEGNIGLLKLRMKNLHDSPTQSVNGSAPEVLLKLYSLTSKDELLELAEKNLQAFSALVRSYPNISHAYLISLYTYIKGVYKVQTEQFFEAALFKFRPFKIVKKGAGDLICEGQTCRALSSPEDI